MARPSNPKSWLGLPHWSRWPRWLGGMVMGSAGHMAIASGLLCWTHVFRDEVLNGFVGLVIIALLLPGVFLPVYIALSSDVLKMLWGIIFHTGAYHLTIALQLFPIFIVSSIPFSLFGGLFASCRRNPVAKAAVIFIGFIYVFLSLLGAIGVSLGESNHNPTFRS